MRRLGQRATGKHKWRISTPLVYTADALFCVVDVPNQHHRPRCSPSLVDPSLLPTHLLFTPISLPFHLQLSLPIATTITSHLHYNLHSLCKQKDSLASFHIVPFMCYLHGWYYLHLGVLRVRLQ